MKMQGPVRVLVCEDHQVVAQGLALLLNAQPDLEVAGIVGTAAEVEEVALSAHPDVVLMDYGLPDASGVEATVALKSALPDVKVVMLTSYADEDVLVAAIDAGCSGFVTKHKGGQEVLAAVRLAAEGEAAVSPDMLVRLLPRLGRSHRGLGWDLTNREREVLEFLADGTSKDAIAQRLFLSPNTVRNHIQSILTKLGAHSRLEAVATATKEGLLSR